MKISTIKGAKGLALAMLVVALGSCGLPRSGPSKGEIFQGSVLKKGDAFIVTVNSRVTRATAVTPALGFGDSFTKAGVIGSDTISPGDVLALTIFENVKDDPLLGNTGQRVSLYLRALRRTDQSLWPVPRKPASGHHPQAGYADP